MSTEKTQATALLPRAICELGDALPVLDKANALFKAIQRLSDDHVVKQLAQVGIDMLSFQWACIDDTHSDIKRMAGMPLASNGGAS